MDYRRGEDFLSTGRTISNTFDENKPSLARALEGGGLSFLFTQQQLLADAIEKLSRCDFSDRMALRRCQADVTCAMKPMCIMAWKAKGVEVRLMALESLMQCVADNVEIAALLGASGLMERAIGHALRPADQVGHQSEYLAALQVAHAVATVVPEAECHRHFLPDVVRMLTNKVDNSVEVRHTALEVLTHVSFAKHRRLEVSNLLPEAMVEGLLTSDAGKDATTLHVASGRSSILDMHPDRLSMPAEAASKISDVNLIAKITSERTTLFSAGAREFTKMVSRTAAGANTDSLMQDMDGYHFNAGLIMANFCELVVPGTDPPRIFAEMARPFWSRSRFFRGLGDCLGAILKGQAWPVMCDTHHKPVRILGTVLHLALNGFIQELTSTVPSLMKAIMVCLEAPTILNGEPRMEMRTARLAAVALRELTLSIGPEEEDESHLASTVRMQFYRNHVRLEQALERLKDEEPAAGDLLDFFRADEEEGEGENWSTDFATPDQSNKMLLGANSLRSCGSIFEGVEEEADTG